MPILLLFLLLCLCGCDSIQEQPTPQVQEISLIEAKNFRIYKINSSQYRLEVVQAWKGANKKISYLLYPRTEHPPTTKHQAIPIPLQRVVCTGNAQVAYLNHLGLAKHIIGLSNADWIYNPTIYQALQNKEIANLGQMKALNIEQLLTLQADAVFVFSLGEQSRIQQLQQLGIPCIYIAEFLESSQLGRAEWLKFFGILFDKQQEAEQSFKQITQEYNELAETVKTVKQCPKVLCSAAYQGNWFLPGGKSLTAELIQKAGGEYLWKDNQETGNINIDLESVYAKAQEAEIWINPSHFSNLDMLHQADARYQGIPAYQQAQVFNYTKRISSNGGYDVFESAYVQPQLLLEDMIKIFHPSVLPDSNLFYYQALQ